MLHSSKYMKKKLVKLVTKDLLLQILLFAFNSSTYDI